MNLTRQPGSIWRVVLLSAGTFQRAVIDFYWASLSHFWAFGKNDAISSISKANRTRSTLFSLALACMLTSPAHSQEPDPYRNCPRVYEVMEGAIASCEASYPICMLLFSDIEGVRESNHAFFDHDTTQDELIRTFVAAPICLGAYNAGMELARSSSTDDCRTLALEYTERIVILTVRGVIGVCSGSEPEVNREIQPIERRLGNYQGPTRITERPDRLHVSGDMSYEQFRAQVIEKLRRLVIYDERGPSGYSFTESLIDAGNARYVWDRRIRGGRDRELRVVFRITRATANYANGFILRIDVMLYDDIEYEEDDRLQEAEADAVLHRAAFGASVDMFNDFRRYIPSLTDPFDTSGSSMGGDAWAAFGTALCFLVRDLEMLSAGGRTYAETLRQQDRVPPEEQVRRYPGTLNVRASLKAEEIWADLPETSREYFRRGVSGTTNLRIQHSAHRAANDAWRQLAAHDPSWDPGPWSNRGGRSCGAHRTPYP